ncbi:MAG TPA: gliding motility-associated C-terminal domain-containing protein [Chitinophagales bacterium]|nr:MAG: hypothetical protein BGO32_02475 [Bacteroidetes bacterium 37-13]HRP40459.1 gliding motility-associated C-terminal domain-containing protein [Chitinophagales bacterium]
MKKVFGFLICYCSLLSSTSWAQYKGCNIQQIVSTFTGQGYVQLNVQGQDCSLYFINPTAQDAAAAQAAAQTLGANLVVMNDAQENQNVVNALNAQNIFANSPFIWMGYKRTGTAAPTFYPLDGSFGSFLTPTTGGPTPGIYQNWSSGEPNNNGYQCSPICGVGCNGYKCSNGEQCVQIYSNGLWNDEACNDNSSVSIIEVNLCPEITGNNDTTVCIGKSVQLKTNTILGSPTFTYTWSSGQTSKDIFVSPSVNTQYIFRATDRYSCYSEDTVNITIDNCPPITGPQGCDMQLIMNTFTGAGYIPLPVSGQDCSLYFINPNSQDAAQAQASASTLGANLVVFNDAQENQNVLNALNANNIYGQYGGTIWIGYKRTGTAASTFYALDGTTGPFTPGAATPSLFQNWASGEPNNNGYNDCTFGCGSPFCSDKYRCNNGEQCVQIYSGGTWNDLPCDRTSVSIIEVNLCPDVNATFNNQTLFNLSKDTTVCSGATVTLKCNPVLGSKPYTYVWTPSAKVTQNITEQIMQDQQYTVKVTDKYSCYKYDTLMAHVQGTFNAGFTPTPAQICDGRSTILNFNGTPSANATFTWGLDGGTVVSGNPSGPGPLEVRWASTGTKNLTLDISDGGCTIPQATGSVTINPNPTTDAGTDQTVCSGGITAIGGVPVPSATYFWSPTIGLSDSTVANPAVRDTNFTSTPRVRKYYLIVSAGGCSGLDSVEVTINPAQVEPVLPASPIAVCKGGSTTLYSAQQFVQKVWNTMATTDSLSVNQSGGYFFMAVDAQGCIWRSDTAQVNISTTPLPITISADGPISFCQGGSVNLSTDSTFQTYSWSNAASQQTINVTASGTFNVTTTDANNCEGLSNDIVVTAYPLPTINLVKQTDQQCFNLPDASITVDAANGTPAYTFTWSSSQTGASISQLVPGTYDVTVVDNNQCRDSQSYTIVAAPAFSATIDSIKNVTCFGGKDGKLVATGVGGTPGYTYLWNTNSQIATLSKLKAGSYAVTVFDSRSCTATAQANVTEPDEIVALPPDTTLVKVGRQINLTVDVTPASNNYTYEWRPQKGLSCYDCPNPVASPIKSIDYTFIVRDANGCGDTIFIPFTVLADKTIYIPNFFTPNGDGNNDFWCLFSDGVVSIDLKVFNRWGEQVFSATDLKSCWDGYYRGEKVDPGMYAYVVRISYIDETWTQREGSVFVYR